MSNTYVLDTTGTLAANKISNETHVITAVNGSAYHIVIPDYAPFYEEGFVLEFTDVQGTKRTLSKGVDYHLSHKFESASQACAKPIYGSVSLLDLSLAGIINIRSYQTLGGNWGGQPAVIMQNLASIARNPRTTTWEQIASLPYIFPPVDHVWNVDEDMVGVSQLKQSLDDIATAVANKATSQVAQTPESVTTKRMLGLEKLDNFATASDQEHIDMATRTKFVTPYGMGKAIAQKLIQFAQEQLLLLQEKATGTISGDKTLSIADHKGTYKTVNNPQLLIDGIGLPNPFRMFLSGPCRFIGTNGSNIVDARQSGSGFVYCELRRVSSNEFIVTGYKS